MNSMPSSQVSCMSLALQFFETGADPDSADSIGLGRVRVGRYDGPRGDARGLRKLSQI